MCHITHLAFYFPKLVASFPVLALWVISCYDYYTRVYPNIGDFLSLLEEREREKEINCDIKYLCSIKLAFYALCFSRLTTLRFIVAYRYFNS